MNLYNDYKYAITSSELSIADIACKLGNKPNSYARINNWLDTCPSQLANLQADLDAIGYTIQIKPQPDQDQRDHAFRVDSILTVLYNESGLYQDKDRILQVILKSLKIIRDNNRKFSENYTDLEIVIAVTELYKHWSKISE